MTNQRPATRRLASVPGPSRRRTSVRAGPSVRPRCTDRQETHARRHARASLGSALRRNYPLAKLVLRDMDAWLLAGVLCLRSGTGLLLVDSGRRLSRFAHRREAAL